ncbi:MAG: hypothetical protein LH615_10465 [Ferruginibacter sp.]|nr:hypothetical protein [Ferruginibacter sp.]
MAEQVLITIKDAKAHKILKSLEEVKFIKIMTDPTIGLSPKKKKQAKNFLAALQEAKDEAKGKIKLKTAESLLNEL